MKAVPADDDGAKRFTVRRAEALTIRAETRPSAIPDVVTISTSSSRELLTNPVLTAKSWETAKPNFFFLSFLFFPPHPPEE